MKYIGYIFLAISSFIVGYAVYLLAKEKSEARQKQLNSLAKARKAKSDYAELRKMETVEETTEPIENVNDALETLSNQILEENATKKEN